MDRAYERFRNAWIDGQGPDPETYCAKFPRIAERLREKIELFLSVMQALRQGEGEVNGGLREFHTLGDFEIVREIGRGGMGVVYEARQKSLGRKVALKVLPPHFTLREETVQRFHREAETMAGLDHKGIVRIYAIGHDDDTHFFAMELVEGASLDKVIATLSEAGAPPLESDGLGRVVAAITGVGIDSSAFFGRTYVESVCRILIQVAEALHYAHEEGVVHRDIKPSNVIIRRDGTPVLTDLGVARVENLPSLTATGDLAGTPHYASPEQARSRQVDRRTDVWALGVTLYELLTLRRPFEGTTTRDILSSITDREPSPPRSIHSLLSRDLETICLKAMEKDPAQRYDTSMALAQDLRRFLAFQPVQARPIGVMTRSWRTLRRHPLPTLSATLLFAALVLAPSFVALNEREANLKVQGAWHSEKVERQRADQEAATAEAVIAFLIDVFEEASPGSERVHVITAAEVLKRGSALAKVRMVERPEVRARLLETLATVHSALGLFEEAEPLARDAVREATRAHGAESVAVLRAERVLGHISKLLGRYGEAQNALDAAAQLAHRLVGEDHPEAIETMSVQASLLKALGEFEASGRLYERVLGWRRERLGEEHEETLGTWSDLGGLFLDQGRYEEAEDAFGRARDGFRRQFGEAHVLSLAVDLNLADLHMRMGNLHESAQMSERAYRGLCQVLGADHPRTIVTLNNLGLALMRLGESERAESLYREALEALQRRLGGEHPSALVIESNLAAFFIKLGKFGEAEPLVDRVYRVRQRVLGERHPDTLTSELAWGRILAWRDREDEAERVFRRVLVARRSLLGEEHPRSLHTMVFVASFLAYRGQGDEAEELYEAALDGQLDALGETHFATLETLTKMARFYFELGHLDDARELAQRALDGTRNEAPEHQVRRRLLDAIESSIHSEG